MNITDKEIRTVLKSYSKLKKINRSGKIERIEGCIELVDPCIGKYDEYIISIILSNKNFSWFPKVFETGKKIPRKPDRHVNPDGSLCVAVRPEEFLICKEGICFKEFIDKILIPHLASETYRRIQGKYPNGEYSHGNTGIIEFYQTIFNTKDIRLIKLILIRILHDVLPKQTEKCFCGSNLLFAECHQKSIEYISKLGKIYIEEELIRLKN